MKQITALISCICITKERPILLLSAIQCFKKQTYANKQLVISYPLKDNATAKILHDIDINDLNLVIIERSSEESLGEARNQAIYKSSGEFICIWDDDDWFHPERLTIQYKYLMENNIRIHASVLTRIILYDKITDTAFYSFPYTWDGSLLCRKEILMQNQYSFLNRAEDTHILKFIDFKHWLLHIQDHPYLYIYIYLGNNSWNYEHFKYFTQKSDKLDAKTSSIIRDLLT